MEGKYRNKYNISSSRLSNWDYGSNGIYFVTICTKDRVHYFGEIGEIGNADVQSVSEAQSSETQSSETQSLETQSIASLRMTEIGEVAFNNWLNIPAFHPYVELDDFVIMPDHMHGILFINKPDKTIWELNKFGAQSKNLASILRGYKSSVKTYATTNDIEFSWQSRYYDRIIRNEKEYHNIKGYIKNNPDQWFQNGDNFENLFNP
ncbi:transposase [Mucilaginibacter sp.]|uniref:transposase n=1 Tax=Mucilaginibacter sp. TaxID=1882438 RepID=UPI00284526BD|nr:transposase [Mucilaginibacter sp.]MDR3693085.1 transposase [Mucilaginibacter sp.]